MVQTEYTLPFNENDITYFIPLYLQTVAMLGAFPTHITADAADLRLVRLPELRASCSHRTLPYKRWRPYMAWLKPYARAGVYHADD